MFSIKVSTPQERWNEVVSVNTTPLDYLNNKDVVLDGCTVSLNGYPLAYTDMNTSFNELGVGDTATLSVVLKAGHAL